MAQGKRPANSIWAWGEGSPIPYPSFQEKYGLRGAVITAVDLLRGIAIGTGMGVISVEGATGNKNTNFAGKGEAAMLRRRMNVAMAEIWREKFILSSRLTPKLSVRFWRPWRRMESPLSWR